MKKMNMKTRLQIEETPHKLSSALFCALWLFLIAIVNKHCSFYGLPSQQFLEFSRLSVVVIILFIGKQFNAVSFPGLSLDIFIKLWPLSLIHVCKMFFAFNDIIELSPSVFGLLRRLILIMTVTAEFVVLDLRVSYSALISIATIILGGLIAIIPDYNFNFLRCLYVLGYDVFFVAYLVYLRRTIYSIDLSVCGILYYSSLFALIPVGVSSYYTNDLEYLFVYVNWANFWFQGCFVASSLLGILVLYSVISCTFHNSALTTAMMDCLKDFCITYTTVIILNDKYSVISFCALTISAIGSLIYIYDTFKKRPYTKNGDANAIP